MYQCASVDVSLHLKRKGEVQVSATVGRHGWRPEPTWKYSRRVAGTCTSPLSQRCSAKVFGKQALSRSGPLPITQRSFTFPACRKSMQKQQHNNESNTTGAVMQQDTQTKTWDTSYEWKIILVLSLTFGLVGLDRFILPVLFPVFMEELNLTYEDLGNLAGILAVFWGISAFAMGFLSDRVGRRKVLIPAVVVFSLMSAFSGMAGGLVALLLIRAVMGLAEGPVASIGVAVAVEASHPKRRGMNNGIFQCMISLMGNAIGPIIATQLLLVTDWRAVFMIVGIPGLIMAAAMYFVVREPEAPAPIETAPVVERPSFTDLFRHRNVPLAMLTLMCAMGGIFVMGAMMPSYLTDYLGLSIQEMGVVTSAIGFGGALGQFAMPTLSDFIGRKITILISYILAAVFIWFFTQTGADDQVALFWLLFFAALF